jgi:hypothetical protein
MRGLYSTLHLCLLHITNVLFIGHKESSEKAKVVNLHYLVGVIRKGRDMDIHNSYYS